MGNRAVCAAIASLVGACSPFGGGAFMCSSDESCSGGMCEANGYCAFPSTTCASGYQYGSLSGTLSNQCVGGNDGADAPPGEVCYGTDIVRVCFLATPSGAQTFGSSTSITTDSSTMCASVANSTAWCVIAADTIGISSGASVRGRGNKPLVLVAATSITIAGTLDVSSGGGGIGGTQTGAGADGTTCNAGTAPTGTGGGAGGSFGTVGGAGGWTGAGVAGNPVTITDLVGGCAGQNGGGTNAGQGGGGGGAVYLISPTITVSGAINASGAGGAVGFTNGALGGGGGGAGGYIGLEGTISNTGTIMANGGGGAGGSAGGGIGGGNAKSGTTPTTTAPTTPAAGGAGGTNNNNDGTAGGAGAAATTAAAPGSSTCTNTCVSGGGGGGGAGIIHVVPGSSLGGMVSPPPS